MSLVTAKPRDKCINLLATSSGGSLDAAALSRLWAYLAGRLVHEGQIRT